MATSRSLNIPKESKLHARLKKKIESRVRLGLQGQQRQHDRWREAEERTLAYLPETEKDAARRNKRNQGTPTYTTIQVPYSYAVLMSAHTYHTSVFFARNPVHQYSGRHGEGEMQVQAMEALIGYQVEVGEMLGPYYIWLYDAGKYGCGIVGEYWDRIKLHYGQIVEMPGPDGKPGLYQTTQEMEGYQGNCIYNVSPWDFVHDPRVSLKKFQNGEFCCMRVRLGWNQILRRKDLGYYNDNTKYLKDFVGVDRSTDDGSSILERPDFEMHLWEDEGEDSKHPAGAVLWEFYAEIVPQEWGVGTTIFPQKWCFTVTEDCALIIGASPLGMMHCKYPFSVLESEVEGYGSYARGVPEIMLPIQNTVDWLVNTHFYNVRAALNNQFIADPSRLVIKDVQNSGPGFVWRLRPEAYGSDIGKMFMQVPVSDVTKAHMADFQQMLGVGERVLGVNDQIMGSLNTGSTRKTATEVRTSTGFGVNRQKTITEYMSATGFAPHSQKLVQNSQQFYTAPQKLRRVGSFALDAGPQFLMVSPEDIVGAFDFVPVDGVLPVDRMAQANLWREMMAGLRMMPPQVAMQYDWTRIFAWVAQLAGLKNINQFRIQVVPDEQLAASAAAGNVIPMPPRGAPPLGPGAQRPGIQPSGPSATTAAGLDAMSPTEPLQIPQSIGAEGGY